MKKTRIQGEEKKIYIGKTSKGDFLLFPATAMQVGGGADTDLRFCALVVFGLSIRASKTT